MTIQNGAFKKTPKKQNKNELFYEKVKNAKNLNELSMLLAIDNQKKYRELILEIEKGELTSLRDAKKLICD